MPPNTKGCELIKDPIFPKYPELREQFERDGYLVIENVVNIEDRELLVNGFWNYIEALSPVVSRKNTETWWNATINNERIWPVNIHGLIQGYNVGFQEFTVKSRMLCKKVFEDLYGTKELVTSFDGISFSNKPKIHKYQNIDDWETKGIVRDAVHVDQTTPGFRCVQGGLALVDQQEDGHVFLCIPGSHKLHDKLLDRIKENCKNSDKILKSDWYILSDEDKRFYISNNLKSFIFNICL
jgi:ectoine hydroxylase-related dioxygenase (phytanoyl-CoA dioxygenase family)